MLLLSPDVISLLFYEFIFIFNKRFQSIFYFSFKPFTFLLSNYELVSKFRVSLIFPPELVGVLPVLFSGHVLQQAPVQHSHVAICNISFNFELTAVAPECLLVLGAVKLFYLWFL